MATMNVAARKNPVRTKEGAATVVVPPLEALRRSVLTCLLWEPTFYTKGEDVAARIADLVPLCDPTQVATLAMEARNSMQLRHVPLFLVRELARYKQNAPLVGLTLPAILKRPDEMTEYLAMYWRDGRVPLSKQSKFGLRCAFNTFSRYQLAKYQDKDKAIKLVDVLRMVRPKPKTAEQSETYKLLRKGELPPADTWESELSAGKDKKATFERLIEEKKLGGLATLRNLRKMREVGVPDHMIIERLAGPMPRVWPYRFIVAAKYAPQLEQYIEGAMLRAVQEIAKLPGKTGLLIDVSGSMDYELSAGGRRGPKAGEPTSRIDVASGLAILLREKADDVMVATFSEKLVSIPPRRGFALRDAIKNSQMHQGTFLAGALEGIKTAGSTSPDWRGLDRLIVITDEQSHDGIVPAWIKQSYVINVAAEQHGVGDHSGWKHIHGWSERIFDYIAAVEAPRE